jgi:hypothetical protein
VLTGSTISQRSLGQTLIKCKKLFELGSVHNKLKWKREPFIVGGMSKGIIYFETMSKGSTSKFPNGDFIGKGI